MNFFGVTRLYSPTVQCVGSKKPMKDMGWTQLYCEHEHNECTNFPMIGVRRPPNPRPDIFSHKVPDVMPYFSQNSAIMAIHTLSIAAFTVTLWIHELLSIQSPAVEWEWGTAVYSGEPTYVVTQKSTPFSGSWNLSPSDLQLPEVSIFHAYPWFYTTSVM